jgi:DNA-directed RNA polymerase specialized sigma24 family protein
MQRPVRSPKSPKPPTGTDDASPRSAPSEPAPELVAHFTNPKLRRRLLGNLKWKLVPERQREDVVQTTMTDAWNARHSWPKTVAELDKVLFTMLRCDRVDAARKNRRAPLLRGDAKDVAATGDAQGHGDEDLRDVDPVAVTVTTEPQEAREGIKQALAYAESRPRLKYAMKWLLQMYMGLEASEIAALEHVSVDVVRQQVSRLRAELRMTFGGIFVVLAIAAVVYAVIHFLAVGRVNDQAHPPRPVPTVVAPPPAPAPAPSPAPASPASPKPGTEQQGGGGLKPPQ